HPALYAAGPSRRKALRQQCADAVHSRLAGDLLDLLRAKPATLSFGYNRLHECEPSRSNHQRMSEQKIRVLIAKPGLDGHDRGAKVVARALRDAGMEVIYTGLRQTPEMIVEAALQEDVDVIGLSILSGAHMALVPRVFELLRAEGLGDVIVLVGGIIPDDDVAALKELGVSAVFGPGTNTEDTVAHIRNAVASRSAPSS